MTESSNLTENAQSPNNELLIFLNKELIKIASSQLPFRKAIPAIQSIFSEIFHFVESQFFFENPDFNDLNKSAQSSEIFLTIIRNLIENGILDWALEQGSVQILPNLDLSTTEIFQKVLIFPIKRKQSNVFFIATLAPDSLLHKYKDLENLSKFFELALLIIFNAYYQESAITPTNTKTLNDISYSKLLYSSARSSVINFIIQGLRTFIKAISAQLQFLLTDIENSERRIKLIEEYVASIQSFVNRISRLNTTEYSPSKVDLSELISEITDILKPICNTTEISINLISNTESYIILSDRNYLEIALFCIIINSIEAIDNSGKIDIILQKTENKKITLSIIDNGCGIAENDIKNIFNIMWTTKDSKYHLGIGLAFVRNFLDVINAKYTIISDVSKGTNFKIVFSSILL